MWAIDMMLRNDETQGHVVETNTKNHISRDMAIAALQAHVETHVIDGYEDAQALIHVLDTLPTIQPETCEGCIHLGKWEDEVEYGYPSPCTCCKRRAVDHYENEVFIVDDEYKENVENLPYTSVQPDPCEEDEELDFVQEHKKLPIALETRGKAHWIEVGREEGALGIEYKCYRCSNCGWESSLPIPRKFCPECGFDMRGEHNDRR